jgi:hypothetical protein
MQKWKMATKRPGKADVKFMTSAYTNLLVSFVLMTLFRRNTPCRQRYIAQPNLFVRAQPKNQNLRVRRTRGGSLSRRFSPTFRIGPLFGCQQVRGHAPWILNLDAVGFRAAISHTKFFDAKAVAVVFGWFAFQILISIDVIQISARLLTWS